MDLSIKIKRLRVYNDDKEILRKINILGATGQLIYIAATSVSEGRVLAKALAGSIPYQSHEVEVIGNIRYFSKLPLKLDFDMDKSDIFLFDLTEEIYTKSNIRCIDQLLGTIKEAKATIVMVVNEKFKSKYITHTIDRYYVLKDGETLLK